MTDERQQPPEFDAAFRRQLSDLFAWRRDVRRFRPDAVPPDLLAALLRQANMAPSVGDSRPWRWRKVEDDSERVAVRTNFAAANASALASYEGERARLYARLKLEGLSIAPVQFAVFCDNAPSRGHGLGRATMPETLSYSVVSAITIFWLAARAAGLGVGWVSILDPHALTTHLDVPQPWSFVAYLCVGWPEEEHNDPELVRHGWVAPRSTD